MPDSPTDTIFFVPPGIDEAESWGANCGPTALAAFLSKTMEEIRPFVSDDGVFRGHMGIKHMTEALGRAGYSPMSMFKHCLNGTRAFGLPEVGVCIRALVMIQWSGPWNSHPRAAARHRHWVVYQRIPGPGSVGTDLVFDGSVRGWLKFSVWHEKVVPLYIPHRGDGKYIATWAASIRRTP